MNIEKSKEVKKMKDECVIFIHTDKSTRQFLKVKAATLGMTLRELLLNGAMDYKKEEKNKEGSNDRS
jgi:hypothetical protein